jgi:hypothetical protein
MAAQIGDRSQTRQSKIDFLSIVLIMLCFGSGEVPAAISPVARFRIGRDKPTCLG